MTSSVGGPARFVIDDHSGRLILFAESEAREAESPALLIPEESEPEIELLLDTGGAETAPTESQRDRWRAYHGAERRGEWGTASAESVRLRASPGPAVFDGPEVLGPNPLRADVARLIREANRRPSLLAMAVRARLGEVSTEPVAVGVDPWGLDVRARFGVVRLEFPEEAPDATAAAAAIGALLEVCE